MHKKQRKAAKRKKTHKEKLKQQHDMMQKMRQMDDEELQKFLGLSDEEFEAWKNGEEDFDDDGDWE